MTPEKTPQPPTKMTPPAQALSHEARTTPLHAGVLAWPAWRRVGVVMPVLVVLWWSVVWAHGSLLP